MSEKMRTLQNWLLIVIGLLLFRMVLWVQEQDPLLGYTLGVALLGMSFFIVVERVNPRK
jgi:hypothetical protein